MEIGIINMKKIKMMYKLFKRGVELLIECYD